MGGKEAAIHASSFPSLDFPHTMPQHPDMEKMYRPQRKPDSLSTSSSSSQIKMKIVTTEQPFKRESKEELDITIISVNAHFFSTSQIHGRGKEMGEGFYCCLSCYGQKRSRSGVFVFYFTLLYLLRWEKEGKHFVVDNNTMLTWVSRIIVRPKVHSHNDIKRVSRGLVRWGHDWWAAAMVPRVLVVGHLPSESDPSNPHLDWLWAIQRSISLLLRWNLAYCLYIVSAIRGVDPDGSTCKYDHGCKKMGSVFNKHARFSGFLISTVACCLLLATFFIFSFAGMI